MPWRLVKTPAPRCQSRPPLATSFPQPNLPAMKGSTASGESTQSSVAVLQTHGPTQNMHSSTRKAILIDVRLSRKYAVGNHPGVDIHRQSAGLHCRISCNQSSCFIGGADAEHENAAQLSIIAKRSSRNQLFHLR